MKHQNIFLGLLFLCSVYALLRGGAPERIGAAIVLAATGLTWMANSPAAVRYSTLESLVLAVDVAMYLALLALALFAQRFWPIWMSAIQGLGVLGHGVGLIGSDSFHMTYAIVVQVWSYPIVLILAVATVRHRRRLRLNGTDPAWSIAQDPWESWKRKAMVR